MSLSINSRRWSRVFHAAVMWSLPLLCEYFAETFVRKAKINSTRRLQRKFHKDKQQTDRWINKKGRSYAGEVSPSTGVDWRAFTTPPTPAGTLCSLSSLRRIIYAHSRGHPLSHANSHFIGNRNRVHQMRTNFPKIRLNFPCSECGRSFFDRGISNYLKSTLNKFL